MYLEPEKIRNCFIVALLLKKKRWGCTLIKFLINYFTSKIKLNFRSNLKVFSPKKGAYWVNFAMTSISWCHHFIKNKLHGENIG